VAALRQQSWQRDPPRSWLCPGHDRSPPLARQTVYRLGREADVKAQVGTAVYPPLVRPALARHLVEAGVDMQRLYRLSGHQSLRTTRRSLPVPPHALSLSPRPLATLPLPPTPEGQPCPALCWQATLSSASRRPLTWPAMAR
jgi:integrase